MMKLYRTNETLFAILWIVLYVVVCGNLRSLGDDSPLMTLGLVAISVVLLWFVRANGLAETYGLSGWAKNSRQMLYFLPLWFLASGNLWGGIEPHYEGLGLACALISMMLVGFVEEFIFRGLLLRAMLKSGSATAAIVVCSVTFGMGHIVNLLTGHELFETSVQMVFAVAVGFVFTLVAYKSGSLLPGIVAHSLIDMFAVVSGRSDLMDWVYLAVSIVIAISYSIYLWRIKPPTLPQAESARA